MKLPTRLIHNRKGNPERRTVNPPVERASTVILPDRQTLYGGGTGYGRMGLSVHRELEAALCDIEGASHARLTPSGLSACAVGIASVVKAGRGKKTKRDPAAPKRPMGAYMLWLQDNRQSIADE